MKTTAALAALMAAGAVAKPHNHVRHAHQQHHRDLEKRMETETVWETLWETQYVTVDATTTIDINLSAGKFFESSSTSTTTTTTTSEEETTTSSSSSSLEEEVAEETTSEAPVEPVPTSSTAEVETSVEYIPPTSSKEEPAPIPTTTTQAYVPPPPPPPPETTSEEPAPEPTEDSNTGGGGSGGGINAQYSGFITYYDVGLGACGWTDTGRSPSGTYDDPMIVAVSYNTYFSGLPNPNHMSLCGQMIAMESPDNPGVVAYGQIRDGCMACTTAGDIDVNLAGMKNFYPGGSAVQTGKGAITWEILG